MKKEKESTRTFEKASSSSMAVFYFQEDFTISLVDSFGSPVHSRMRSETPHTLNLLSLLSYLQGLFIK